MDRRCLEVANIRRAMVTVSMWYPAAIELSKIHFQHNLDDTVEQINEAYYDAFHTHYSGMSYHTRQKIFHIFLKYTGHRCSLPGCGITLVIDGNMKIHRNVCAAKDAGYVEFEGLPGSVKTGCMNTPMQQSVFCDTHEIRGVQEGGMPPAVCQMIIGHRYTRAGVMYQVRSLCCDCCST